MQARRVVKERYGYRRKIYRRTLWIMLIIPVVLAVCGYKAMAVDQGMNFAAPIMKDIEGSGQVIVVTTEMSGSFRGLLSRYEKRSEEWVRLGEPVDVVIGRNGFAPIGSKREGDGKTPSGVFLLGFVFGYEPAMKTMMRYRQATKDDVWIDDVRSPSYNRWVRREQAGTSGYEEMRRADDLYRYGIVVEYNTDPVVAGRGSAIFLHLWRNKDMPTAGCVAMSAEHLGRIIEWLDPGKLPKIVMGISAALFRK